MYRLDFKIKSYNSYNFFIFCENKAKDELIERKYIYNSTVANKIIFNSKPGLYFIGVLLWDKDKFYDIEIHKFKIRKEDFIIRSNHPDKSPVKTIETITPIDLNTRHKGKQLVSNINEAVTDLYYTNAI